MKQKRFMILSLLIAVLALCGCAGIQSTLNEWQGNLVGVSFTVETYDNYGKLTLTTKGDKIKLAGNKIEEMIATDDGWVRHYEMSSVLTVTIDGKEMETCGDTMLFTEKDSKRNSTLPPRSLSAAIPSSGISRTTPCLPTGSTAIRTASARAGWL